ncbi:MAG: FHIPEP family type III secretion protein, partial [Leptospiraceae bacterium]|nr:FHIPEP family type III secretion protein [Leptospiraceae bacterium]
NNKFTIINSISLINTQLSEIINLQADRIYGQDKYKDKITLHLGVNLLDLVRSSELQNSISVSRKLFAERNGWSFSAIRILDNLLLQPYEYSISIQGKLIGSNYLEPNKLLAMVPYSSSEKYEVINSIVGYGIWMDNEVEFENLPEDSIPFSHADLIAYHLEKIILDNSEIFQKGN